MVSKMSALAMIAVALLAGCGKAPPLSGTGALKLKDPVWATYGWSKGRMAYIIYFIPSAGAFDPDNLAATAKIAKEGDTFEGALDGYKEKSKSPFRADPKKGEVLIEGRTYRGSSVFLVNPAAKEKVQMVQGVAFLPAPKDPEEWPTHAEAEVKRIAKDTPKVAEFPAPEKTETKKKK